MKKILTAAFCGAMASPALAQGWPTGYEGVMVQGFYWDSYSDSQWKNLEKQAPELGSYFSLLWVPQSGKCLEEHNVMGYTPYYYFDQNSSFGSEAELRSMIRAMRQNGVGVLADVVINHRGTLTNWVDFPVETYNGQTYKMESTDICADDDGGKCKAWADKNGYKLSSNNDTGESWDGRASRSAATRTRAKTGMACATSTTKVPTCNGWSRPTSSTSWRISAIAVFATTW